MENNRNLRNIVLNMLSDTLDKGDFSHIVINRIFEDGSLSYRDRSFINRLYSGTLEKLVQMDFYITAFSNVPLKKIKPVIRNILRMSIYQMLYMDSVPVHSCIDEAVKLARKRGLSNLTGFVNGILRKAQREIDGIELPDFVKASAPKWLYELVMEQYGSEISERCFVSEETQVNETIVRLNLGADKAENIIKLLQEDNCSVRKLGEPEGAAAISGFESLTELKAFKKGLIIMQDRSSMIAVETAARGLAVNNLTIDVCAAPGGKSLYMAEKFPEARIIARDLTEYKVGLINNNIKRLHIGNIEAQVHDALKLDESMIGKADVVIADLPCSGLGVFKKKPDILYRVKESDLAELASLQRNILGVVQSYVKKGGVLLFSTCTINKGENCENTRWFLDNYDFRLEYEKQFIPGIDDTDGFYIAKLIRR